MDISFPNLTDDQRRLMREAEYDFHVRAFGEEMARINFLPLNERRHKVAEIVDFARTRGYRPPKTPRM